MVLLALNTDGVKPAGSIVANFANGKFYIQVRDAGSIRLGSDLAALNADVDNLKGEGLEISKNDGVREFTWKGPLAIIANAPGPVRYDLEFFDYPAC